MARFRTVLFWLHLTAGVAAGLVVLIMSATGVALTYEKQVLEWADRRAWSAPPSRQDARLSPETLLVKGDTVFMCADCGEKFIQPPPKLKSNASSPPSASSL